MRVIIRVRGELKRNITQDTIIFELNRRSIKLSEILKKAEHLIGENIVRPLLANVDNENKIKRNIVIIVNGKSIRNLDTEICSNAEIEISILTFMGGG